MTKRILMAFIVALGLAASTEGFAGQDEPKVLTPAQMDTVAAGSYDEDYNDATGRASGNGSNCCGSAYPLPPGTRTGTPRLIQGTGGDTSPTGSYNRDACCT